MQIVKGHAVIFINFHPNEEIATISEQNNWGEELKIVKQSADGVHGLIS